MLQWPVLYSIYPGATMANNPHPLIPEVEAAEVGELQIRYDTKTLFAVPPDWTVEQIQAKIDEIGGKPGTYYVYPLHYSTKKQMKGFATFEVAAKGIPADSSPTALNAALMEHQFKLLSDMMTEVRSMRAALEERSREIDRERADFEARQHAAEMSLLEKRHEQTLDHQDKLRDVERDRERALEERQARLDAAREALDLERQKLLTQSFTERMATEREVREREIAQLERDYKRRLETLSEQAAQTAATSDPLALVRLLPPKVIAKLVESQIPKNDDDELATAVRYIEPIAQLLGSLRPGGAPAIPGPALPAVPATAPRSSPPTPTRGKVFRG